MENRFTLDVNTAYPDARLRRAAAAQILNSIPFGRNNVIKVDVDDSTEKVFFTLTATGQRFDLLEDAISEAQGIFVGEIASFNPRTTHVGFSTGLMGPEDARAARRVSDPYGTFENIFQDIYQQLSGGDRVRQALREAGLDLEIDDITKLQADIITFSPSEGRPNEIAKEILRMQEEGPIRGIPVIDTKGARVIQFRAGDKVFDMYQANLLLAMTGHSVSNIDVIQKAIDSATDTDAFSGSIDKLASMFEKQIKRERAFVSARDVSLSGNELSEILHNFGLHGSPLGNKFEDKVLVIDPQYEILKVFSGSQDDLEAGLSLFDDEYVKEYYRQTFEGSYSPEKMIRNILEASTSDSEDEISAFLGDLRTAVSEFESSYDRTKPGFVSDSLSVFLEQKFSGQSQAMLRNRRMSETLFKSIEHGFDGSDPLNARFVEHLKQYLKGKISDLRESLPGASEEAAREIRKSISQNGTLLSKIENGDLGQITGRGNMFVGILGEFRNIKNAWDATRMFKGILNDKIAVVSKSSFKKDTTMAGDISSFVISGLGSPRDYVYADPVTLSFSPESFTDPATLKMIEDNAKATLDEAYSVTQSRRIPEKLKAIVDKQAQLDLSSVPIERRATASKSKEFAQDIQRMILSGANPKDHPLMASLIHNFYATMMYSERKGKIYPAIPGLYRFQLDTERAGDIKLTEGLERMPESIQAYDVPNATWTSINMAENTRVLKARMKGHKMFLPFEAVGKYFHSLGGFDLDDKGIPRLVTYRDNKNMNRLGFYLFRQPSGPEEVVFGRLQLDADTIRSLFDNTYFKSALSEMISETSVGPLMQDLKEISSILENPRVDRLTNADSIESVIVSVYQRMQSKRQAGILRLSAQGAQKFFGNKAGSSLAIEDMFVEEFLDETQTTKRVVAFDPKYTSRGIYKAFLEEGAFDMSDVVKEVADKFNIGDNLRAQLTEAFNQHATDPMQRQQKMFQVLGDAVSSGSITSETSAAIIDTASGLMRLKGMSNAQSFLGSYVNRSMVVGSILDQYGGFLDAVSATQGSTAMQEYMLKNFDVGLLAQETAIDLATTLSRSKIVHSETRRMLAEGYESISGEQRVLSSLKKLHNLGPDGAVTIDDFGKAAIENLGRMIGFGRTLSGSQSLDPNLKLGIDVELIKGRLTADDRQNLLNAIISGHEQATRDFINPGNLNGLSVDEDFTSKLSEYQRAIDLKDDIKIEELLIRDFGLGAKHAYSSVAKITELGKKIEAYQEAQRRASIRNIGDSAALALADVGDLEKTIARNIVERNKELIEEVFDITNAERIKMGQLDFAEFKAKAIGVANKVFDELSAGFQIPGITRQKLVNAVDQVFAETISRTHTIDSLVPLINPDDDKLLDPKHEKALEYIRKGRERRRIDDALSLNESRRLDSQGKTLAEETLEAIKRGMYINDIGNLDYGDPSTVAANQQELLRVLGLSSEEVAQGIDLSKMTGDDLIAAAETALSYLPSTDPDLERMTNPLLALSERINEIEDQMQRLSAGTEADIVKSLLDDEIFDENMRAQLEETVGDVPPSQVDDEVGRIMSELTEEEGTGIIDRAKYSRVNNPEMMNAIKGLWEDKFFRRSTLGIGALIIASFAYTSIKDRSHEDIAGPPMLPGGSAYETDYPKYRPQTFDPMDRSYSSGMSYNISISGNQNDIDRFNQQASGLTNGDLNTTMYTGAPDLGGGLFDRVSSML